MAIGVGLRIGRIVSTAVVASNEPGTPDPVVIARDTVLHIDHDGNSQLGGSTRTVDEARTLSGFLSRVGDPGGIAASDGRVYRAEDAMATAVHCLLNECHPLPTFGGMDRDTDPGYTATYPSHWDPTRVSVLRAALDYAELRHVDLVSDAQGAATWYASEISETPGLLIGVYHVDDAGSTVTLVRSGVPAGKAFRVTAKGAPSPAAQLATALGAFGWMPDNLDAVVVMGDGLIARDRSHIQDIANSLATKLMVRSLVGPGPEQTAALGAAILATGFTPAREKKARIGLPPSYDRTDVLTGGFARLREAETDSEDDPPVAVATTTDSGPAREPSSRGSSASEVVDEDQKALTVAHAAEPPAEPKLSARTYALAGIGAVIVVCLVLALML
ncbi:hypothetical protein HCA61_15630 [Rhodococcus sp. HNM0563]|uniref:hypothetical protein n=1 Tax=Rhodococcus sp. HNM0563 TaxID=2716339 RepID=UPI00146C11BC|nr:hypothetical protein [Rhodococcus sp. HNM0563]NLU63686.1 hypothetical protein [Rhodococcus sp. HNM0563]